MDEKKKKANKISKEDMRKRPNIASEVGMTSLHSLDCNHQTEAGMLVYSKFCSTGGNVVKKHFIFILLFNYYSSRHRRFNPRACGDQPHHISLDALPSPMQDVLNILGW